jgi:nitrate/nitrite transporter NarK
VTDLLAIAVIVGGFVALVFLAALLWLGLRCWLMCGSFASGHRIIDAWHAQQERLFRVGMREADKRGWIKGGDR